MTCAASAAAAKLVFTTHEPADAFIYAGTWKPWAEKVVADSNGTLEIADIAFIVLPNDPNPFA